MLKFIHVQTKRIARVLPGVLVVVIILFAGMLCVFNAIANGSEADESEQKYRIAIVGEGDDSYLNMSIQAVQSFDSSRFALSILRMEEEEAVQKLDSDEIAAYVVMPEGFMDAALNGQVKTLKFVSKISASGLSALFKNEVTSVIANIVLACQRGMYGIESVTLEFETAQSRGKLVEELSLTYVDYVLIRSKTYEIHTLGVTDNMSMDHYVLCGLTVLFLFLSVLPFVPVYIKHDFSMDRMLCAKGRPVIAQAICEYAVYFFSVVILLITAFAGLFFIDSWINIGFRDIVEDVSFGSVWALMPPVFMITALSYMLCQCTGGLISGILLQFGAGLVLCFISGCLYPLFFFPESVQEFAAHLPMSYGRAAVADCLAGSAEGSTVWMLLLYGAVFAVVAVLLRKLRTEKIRG